MNIINEFLNFGLPLIILIGIIIFLLGIFLTYFYLKK
jgi:hypothetical protein